MSQTEFCDKCGAIYWAGQACPGCGSRRASCRGCPVTNLEARAFPDPGPLPVPAGAAVITGHGPGPEQSRQPVTVSVAVAPGRLADHELSGGGR
jgi:hypothetical protein